MSDSEARSGGVLRRLGRKMPAAAWVAVGLVGAAIIAPASAVAASNLVGIVGSNGTRAAVTTANALETAPASPSDFISIYGSDLSGACSALYKVPAHQALIIQSVTFNNLAVNDTGSGFYTGLFTKSTCSHGYFLDNNPGGIGETTVPLTPGIAFKAGTTIYQFTDSDLDTEVWIDGYLVPASAVPATHVGASALHRQF